MLGWIRSWIRDKYLRLKMKNDRLPGMGQNTFAQSQAILGLVGRVSIVAEDHAGSVSELGGVVRDDSNSLKSVDDRSLVGEVKSSIHRESNAAFTILADVNDDKSIFGSIAGELDDDGAGVGALPAVTSPEPVRWALPVQKATLADAAEASVKEPGRPTWLQRMHDTAKLAVERQERDPSPFRSSPLTVLPGAMFDAEIATPTGVHSVTPTFVAYPEA